MHAFNGGTSSQTDTHGRPYTVFICCPILQKLWERDRGIYTDCERESVSLCREAEKLILLCCNSCLFWFLAPTPASLSLGSQTRATKQCFCHCWRKLLILLSAAWSAQTGDWSLMRDRGVHIDQRVCYTTVGRHKIVVVCKVCVDIDRNLN